MGDVALLRVGLQEGDYYLYTCNMSSTWMDAVCFLSDALVDSASCVHGQPDIQ